MNAPFCFCLAGNEQGASPRVWVVGKKPNRRPKCTQGRVGGVGGPIHRSLKYELLGAISRPWMGAMRSPDHLPTSDGYAVTSAIERFMPE